MTARLCWTQNGCDMRLQPRRWTDSFVAIERGDWQSVDIHGADHLRSVLGLAPDSFHTLRQLLLSEGRFDLARHSDQQVLEEVARLLQYGHWQLLRGIPQAAAPATRPVETAPAVVQPASSAPQSASSPAPSPAETVSQSVAVAATVVAAAAVAAVAATALASEAQQPQHWIEIELVGEDDQPIANEAYEVTLPDQQVVKGNLDAAGWARIDNIASAGTCRVSFPRLDEAAWVVHAQSPLEARGAG